MRDVDGLYLGQAELLGLENEALLLFLAAEYLDDGCAAHPVGHFEHEAVLDALVEVRRLIVLKHFFQHL